MTSGLSAPPNPQALEERLNYKFCDALVLERALTHKSYANERASGASTVGSDNERFEFLGDAVLDLSMSEALMKRFPEDTEGALSKKRASLVNEETLAGLATELKLEELLRLGKGEIKTGGLQKPRILASALEAVVGAVFIDGGYVAAAATIGLLFHSRIEELGRSDVDFRTDFKTRLQEKIQELHRSVPVYRVHREFGPDHDKNFEVSVSLGGDMLAIGQGKSKKSAEQDAARQALEKL